jgi:hypothetical protein
MQANLERGKAASGARSVSRLAILAGVPLIATLALCAPDRALAACGATHLGGIHTGVGGAAHAATARPPSGGGGGGGGCSSGSSASVLHGLPMAASGRVLEGEANTAAHTTLKRTASSASALHGLPMATSGRVLEGEANTAAHTTAPIRTATTRTADTGAHLRH